MDDDDWNVRPGHGLGPLELDLDRESLLERLDGVVEDLNAPDDDPTFAELEDGDIELTFAADEPHRLQQISVFDDRVQRNSAPILERRVDELLAEWQIDFNQTLWKRGSTALDVQEQAQPPHTPSDRQLLQSANLWIPQEGLGLVVEQGIVEELVIRLPELAPRSGYGPFTESQRVLLNEPDLGSALTDPPAPGAVAEGWIRSLLTLACVAGVALVAWQGFQYQVRWNQSLSAEGTVIAVKPPPPDPFPDELTVEYADPTGKQHQTVFRRADVYITREVGEKVEVRYLPEAPDQPLGPARYRDAAFVEYMPYGIGIVAVYLVLLVINTVVCKFLGRGFAAERSVADDGDE